MTEPEMKVFIDALRSGKPSGQAFSEYCWAKSVVLIAQEDLERFGDPFACKPQWRMSMAEAMGSDAFDDGADDQAISEEFYRGMEYDRERGLLYRAALKSERPTPGELLRAMGEEGQMRAVELFGLRAVIREMYGR